MESLEFVAKTQHSPKEGDVFALKLKGGLWLFGRVASATPPTSPWGNPEEGVVLIYVFDVRSSEPTPPGHLSLETLLMPPLIVIDELWNSGYVLPLGNRAFDRGERYERHCFTSSGVSRMCDDKCTVVTEPFEPTVDLDLHSLLGLDQAVAAAINAKR